MRTSTSKCALATAFVLLVVLATAGVAEEGKTVKIPTTGLAMSDDAHYASEGRYKIGKPCALKYQKVAQNRLGSNKQADMHGAADIGSATANALGDDKAASKPMPRVRFKNESVSVSQESYSGIYPHLAYFNYGGECGTGAVVPWADRLWVITYSPHSPKGSSDKLYEITPELRLITRPESIGGTPANRLIHRESNQLFIGPYAIDGDRSVRVIPYSRMLGRHTGNARHLTDPRKKIYYATMEEGFYEVDVDTLKVTELFADTHARREPRAGLPGYHGKGLYSGQGRLIYANNGETGSAARSNPFTASGALAEWNGTEWTVILRNQFTEVTGPGGIYGNDNPESDPVWSIGWDARSLILMCLNSGKWHKYRLPKASHSYDGAHGWNTEWPRIREIGEDDLLMTMHGMFWRFPKMFSADNTGGIAPRSSYLKVVGDFCRWNDRIVLGCDDTAANEFLNKRRAKGDITGSQSQSNLWFIKPAQLDQLGPVLGRGAVWLEQAVTADETSDPFLLFGFTHRGVHLATDAKSTITLEIDRAGKGQWEQWCAIEVDGYQWHALDDSLDAVWIRVRSSEPLSRATVMFQYGASDDRDVTPSPAKFAGVAKLGDENIVGGLIRANSGNERTLQLAAVDVQGKVGNYILDGEMKLTANDDDKKWDWLQENAAIPSRKCVVEVDDASVIYTDDKGQRFRLPKNPEYAEPGPLGFGRLCREIATERDLFNCHGTFFELPADNAAGFCRVRPVATHNLQIFDYCSYRGLFVISGINLQAAGDNRHIIRSDDGSAAVWVGTIDDVWQLGKPVGVGGPWLGANVKAGEVSDPYLMTGYDEKTLTLRSDANTTLSVELDLSGTGLWQRYASYDLKANQPLTEKLPDSLNAYWIRFRTSDAARVDAQLTYE